MNILSDRMENSLTARINQELCNKDSPIQILKFANYRQKEKEIEFSVIGLPFFFKHQCNI